MAISDFLSNGQVPAGSAVTSTTSSTTMPDWYTNYAMQMLSNQNAVSAQPLSLFQGPRVAEFSPTQQQGFDMAGEAATAYEPALNTAMQGTEGALNAPSGMSVAQPYFTQAGKTSVANIGQYMNPYTENVVSRIAELGQRNLTENLMPAIEGRYIGAGQLGGATRGGGLSGAPSGMLTDTARALRDTNADILGQQSQALQSGYTGALTASAADLSRLATLGTNAASIAGNDVTQQLNASKQMGELGAEAQKLGLTGAGALQTVGAAQQAQAQKNIDIANADFLKEQGYPQEQIDNALRTLGAVKAGVPTSTSTEGIVPNSVPTTSTAQNIGAGLAGTAGILSALSELGLKF